jgi:hypothetical protein
MLLLSSQCAQHPPSGRGAFTGDLFKFTTEGRGQCSSRRCISYSGREEQRQWIEDFRKVRMKSRNVWKTLQEAYLYHQIKSGTMYACVASLSVKTLWGRTRAYIHCLDIGSNFRNTNLTRPVTTAPALSGSDAEARQRVVQSFWQLNSNSTGFLTRGAVAHSQLQHEPPLQLYSSTALVEWGRSLLNGGKWVVVCR